MAKKTASIRVWMEDELELELRRLAEADERDLSDYCRVVLRRHVAQMNSTDLRESRQSEPAGRSVPINPHMRDFRSV